MEGHYKIMRYKLTAISNMYFGNNTHMFRILVITDCDYGWLDKSSLNNQDNA